MMTETHEPPEDECYVHSKTVNLDGDTVLAHRDPSLGPEAVIYTDFEMPVKLNERA